jgi:RNA polymerase sigma factor (sigma-70 family)
MFDFFRRRHPAEAEFRALIERYAGLMRKTLRQIDARMPEADLEELEQDVRLKIWQALSTEGDFDKPAAFIRKVIINVSIDAARKRLVRGSAFEHVEITALELGADFGEQAAQAHAMEIRAELSSLCKSISDENPDAAKSLGLYLQGFTTEEIGALMGWSEAKARNIVYRFLDQVRAKYSP